MSDKKGWIAVDRGMIDHPALYEDPKEVPWTKAQAWLWMLCEARREDRKVPIKGKIVTIKRGQFSHSIRFMADKFGWHRNKVDRFILALTAGTGDGTENEPMVGTDVGTGQLIVTICNYDRFQFAGGSHGTARGTENFDAVGQGVGQHRDSNGTESGTGRGTARNDENPNEIREKSTSENGAWDSTRDSKNPDRGTKSQQETYLNSNRGEGRIGGTGERKETPSTDPDPQDQQPQAAAAKKSDRTRLREDWYLPVSWGEWARIERGMEVRRIRDEAHRFKTYYLESTRKNAARKDWYRTWQNWIIKTQTDEAEREARYQRARTEGVNGKPVNGSAAEEARALLADMDRREEAIRLGENPETYYPKAAAP